MTKNEPARVLIALVRPADYMDVHPDLVIEDAMRENSPWEFVRDDGAEVIVALDRLEGYERASSKSMAEEFARSTWPSWRVVKV